MHSDNFRIAIIGRTNVGKSTLFNRLAHKRSAITFDRLGVTRDAKEMIIDIYDKKAVLIDSPGMFDYNECDNKPELIAAIKVKINETITSASLILFVVDGVAGICEYDRDVAFILRKKNKNIAMIVNKCEKKDAINANAEAAEFGFENIFPISAEHGLGIPDLCEFIVDKISSFDNKHKLANTNADNMSVNVSGENKIRLAIIGRPNVGKSTIVNKIIGANRQLVADFAGLTRESAGYIFDFDGTKIEIVDTPGLRRKNKVYDILEKISVSNAKKAYKSADVVVLLIDATTLECGEIEKQDITLAANIIQAGKAFVIAFNKVDQTPYKINEEPQFLKRIFANNLSQLKKVPFLFVSAINGGNIKKMLELVVSLSQMRQQKIKTSALNNWLLEINNSDLMLSSASKFKLKYIVQVATSPPNFLIFVANKKNIRQDQIRFIENHFKKYFNVEQIPVNICFKEQ